MNLSPQKEETTEQTESQVIAQQNVAEQPKEIKEDYIEPKKEKVEVGISAFKNENVQAEIQSPFRKKRGTLSLSNIRKDSNEESGSSPKKEMTSNDFSKLMPVFNQIKANLETKKVEFEGLKKLSLAETTEMFNKNEL